MTTPADETDRQIAAEVLPPSVTEPAVPITQDSLPPWHTARKQFVREKQLILLSRRLIRRARGRPSLPETPGSVPEVRYLTLPGRDFVDVSLLSQLCEELNCCLTSTGFQSGGEGNAIVARAQLREKSMIDAGQITDRSHTFSRRFENIVHTNSQAFRDLKGRGPFHIVNLDACGSIAAPGAHHANRLIEALHRLLELQLELMSDRWLLFVTTDASPDSIARDTLDHLCNAIFENAENNTVFRECAIPLLNRGGSDIRAAAESASKANGADFLRLLSLGLAKWLLRLANEKNWDVKTHSPYCYSTRPAPDRTPSMTCLAFEFRPPPPGLADPLSVSRAAPRPPPPYRNRSVMAATSIGKMIDADSYLHSNHAIRRSVTDRLLERLREAGYEDAALAPLRS